LPAAAKKYVRNADLKSTSAPQSTATTVAVVANASEAAAAAAAAASSSVAAETASVVSDVGEPPLGAAAIVRQLRLLGEPATLFAESNWDRYRRFRRLEASRPAHDEKLVGVQEDDFGAAMRALASKEKDSAIDAAANTKRHVRDADEGKAATSDTGAAAAAGAAANSTDAAQKPMSAAERAIQAYLDEQRQQEQQAKRVLGPEKAAYKTEGDLTEAEKDQAIAAILKRFMREWDELLAARPESESKTPQGRIATATFAQCTAHIEPLFRALAKNALHAEIRQHLFKICVHMERKEYVKAHDAYILLSIGNAAWPMGVTMVGIHERAGRSRIEDTKTSHILNDETQRKYIQSVKRLLSFAQTRYPTKPSQMVVF
jgi:pre-mRNA-splicing factor 18